MSKQTVIDLVNQDRKSEKIKVLVENKKLSAAAQAKANDMLKNQYFSHTSPAGKRLDYFINNSGYKNWSIVGENLAMGFKTEKDAERAFMESPTHRDNILDKNFKEIGVGIACGKYYNKNTCFIVQMFGKK